MPEEKSVEWYESEIQRLEELQKENVISFTIGGVVLGAVVLILYYVISEITRVWYTTLAAVGILLIIGGIALIPWNNSVKKKREGMINDLKTELAALRANESGHSNS